MSVVSVTFHTFSRNIDANRNIAIQYANRNSVTKNHLKAVFAVSSAICFLVMPS